MFGNSVKGYALSLLLPFDFGQIFYFLKKGLLDMNMAAVQPVQVSGCEDIDSYALHTCSTLYFYV